MIYSPKFAFCPPFSAPTCYCFVSFLSLWGLRKDLYMLYKSHSLGTTVMCTFSKECAELKQSMYLTEVSEGL